MWERERRRCGRLDGNGIGSLILFYFFDICSEVQGWRIGGRIRPARVSEGQRRVWCLFPWSPPSESNQGAAEGHPEF